MKNKSHLQVRVLKSSIRDFEMLHWELWNAPLGTLKSFFGDIEMLRWGLWIAPLGSLKCFNGDVQILRWGFWIMLKVHLENFERSFQNFWTFRNIFLNVHFFIFERSFFLQWRFKIFLMKVRHSSETPKENFNEHYRVVVNPLKNIADSSALDCWIQCRELIGMKDSHDRLKQFFHIIQTI